MKNYYALLNLDTDELFAELITNKKEAFKLKDENEVVVRLTGLESVSRDNKCTDEHTDFYL